jgi:starch-binding outer membrane protein, SusD/RagB family
MATGCDSLVEYEEKDVVPPEAVAGPAGAEALVRNARNAFTLALNGDGGGGLEGIILVSGLLSDEFHHSGTFGTRVDVDFRAPDLQNATLSAMFRQLQNGRVQAARALSALSTIEGFSFATDTRGPEMANFMGAVFLQVAQNYCSGIPFSIFQGGELIAGSQLTTTEIIDSAIVYFDQALAGHAGAGGTNHHFANLLKARGLIMKSRANLPAAVALVAGVPTNYRFQHFHAEVPTALRNGIYVFNVQNERWSLSHNEGINGLPFRGEGDGTLGPADPRVPWVRTLNPNGTLDVGFDNNTPQYDLQIYATRIDPSVFLRGVEARLIEIEAKLEAGDATWLTDLNTLRGTVGLFAVGDPGTAEGRVKLLFDERAFWLFATGTRIMDLRRMIRQYGFAAESVFPTGAFFKGGFYGPDVNLPVPDIERNNPLYADGITCFDRAA